jgi:putative pyruvate formate lyase activating enzyme
MGVGGDVSARELGDIMLTLQHRGAHNINFVTPSHVVHAIISALVYAIEGGLRIPLVYNSSGYDSLEELELLDGIIDIYMPDMKYSDDEVAKKYSNAPNYVEVNRKAIKEMHRQVGTLVMDKEGIAMRGLLIRHLVLPEGLAGTEEVLAFIANEISKNTYISLMSQYFPTNKAFQYPEISRMVNRSEYRKAVDMLHRFGLENGYIQGM